MLPPLLIEPEILLPGHVRHRLTIAFDGTAYYGWQRQPHDIAVQQRVEEALAKLFPSAPCVHSSSRTDTGVHALGMVAHFDVPEAEFRMLPAKLILAANAHLPEDIRVLAVTRARADFHARFSARGKQYRYLIWNHSAHNPLLRTQAWHVPRALDLAAMRTAAATLVGRRDFLALSATPGYARRNSVRNLTRCDVRGAGPLLTVVIEADGFLYKMCRGIVGTLVEVGLHRLPARALLPMLAQRNRSLAGMTAPAHGLVLWKVHYGRKAKRPSEAAPTGPALLAEVE
ncbi:MAG TPA: tRNA pseudouridine(38-40) synthase TruA [Candidatus Limnocylindria bacterium]|jgi:tRNA pseudouridine38-40 synthase|nr:tRNA pseudouridine(38-40) synthase TruA [Candidatus Limnocylindria bacterium]